MDMREKMARALLEHGLGQGAWNHAIGLTRDAYFAAADAALAALEERPIGRIGGAHARITSSLYHASHS